MKRLITALAAVALVAAGAPASAAPSAGLPKAPAGPVNAVVNPDGDLVTTYTLAGKKSQDPTMADHIPQGAADQARTESADELPAGCQVREDSPTGMLCYLYNQGIQDPAAPPPGLVTTHKAGGHQGALHAANTYHTVGQIAVMDIGYGPSRNIVELGVQVSYRVNGDYKPTVFGGAWVNGGWLGNSGPGFTFVSGTSCVPGVTEVLPGANVDLAVFHQDAGGAAAAGWWLSCNSEWVGYYPDSLWTNASPAVTNFTRINQYQLFGEIASQEDKPCTDMGLGLIASNAGAARFGDTKFLNTSRVASTTGVNLSTYRTPSATAGAPYANTYGEGPAGTQRSFRYGGPMWNNAGTGVGVIGEPC